MSSEEANKQIEEKKVPLKEVIKNKNYLRWSIAIQFMRMPSLMTSLAFVIIGYYATGSHAVGGIMVTVYTLSLTFFAVPGGRLVDKMGITRGLMFLLIGASMTFLLLTIATAVMAHASILIILAGIAGAFLAGAPGGFRTMLSRTIPNKLIPAGIAFDATMIEVVVISAPLIAGLAATIWTPGAAFSMVVASLLSALLTYALARDAEDNKLLKASETTVTESFNAPKRLWLNPRFIFWLLVSIAFGHALGTAETGAFPISQYMGGGANAAAILIGVIALSSIVSGLLYAIIEPKLKSTKFAQSCVLLAIMVIGCFGLYWSENWIPLIISLLLIGACTSPLMIARSQAVEEEIPIDRKSEGFSLVNASHSIGFGLGGLFLAALPLSGMLAAGGISGLIVLLLAPILYSKKLYNKSTALIEERKDGSTGG